MHKKSVKRAVKKPSVKRAVKKSVKRAVKKSVKRVVKKSVKRTVKKSVKRTVKKPSVKRVGGANLKPGQVIDVFSGPMYPKLKPGQVIDEISGPMYKLRPGESIDVFSGLKQKNGGKYQIAGFDKKNTKFPRKMSKEYCIKTSCKHMGFSQKASCRYYKNCYK